MAGTNVIELRPPTLTMSPAALGEILVRARARFREIDHADWDGTLGRYQLTDTEKWIRAAQETARMGGVCPRPGTRWDYYGGPDLLGEGRR
jgi:broad specificity phosphatase PhoE